MDRSKKDEGKSIYRIPPYYYIHVLDQNSNVTKLVVGPQTFIRQDNEKVCVCVCFCPSLCVFIYMYVVSYEGGSNRAFFKGWSRGSS